MDRLRIWFVVVLGWFFLFYNVERFSEPINIASFMYVLVPALAILIILIPQVKKISWPLIFLSSVVIYFVLKLTLDDQIVGRELPITITEICALAITLGLSYQVGEHLEAFRRAVMDLMINDLKALSQPFEVGQAAMYREVRQARIHQRPLAVLAIAATDETVKLSINRFIEEVQHKTIKHYLSARMANFLLEEMRDYDLIAQRNNHFISLLPGVDRAEVIKVVQKLENTAREKLGLTLKIGVSTFPEEITFEKLVEQAEQELQGPSKRNKQTEDGHANVEAVIESEGSKVETAII
jgi:hypothetical protein